MYSGDSKVSSVKVHLTVNNQHQKEDGKVYSSYRVPQQTVRIDKLLKFKHDNPRFEWSEVIYGIALRDLEGLDQPVAFFMQQYALLNAFQIDATCKIRKNLNERAIDNADFNYLFKLRLEERREWEINIEINPINDFFQSYLLNFPGLNSCCPTDHPRFHDCLENILLSKFTEDSVDERLIFMCEDMKEILR